jgi:hypothetical protein
MTTPEDTRALVDAGSLGTPEAKALRESTPPEVAQAIVQVATWMERAESAEEETEQLRAEVDRLKSALADATAAVERVEDLQEVWERTEPHTLMSRRRAAAILAEVIRP